MTIEPNYKMLSEFYEALIGIRCRKCGVEIKPTTSEGPDIVLIFPCPSCGQTLTEQEIRNSVVDFLITRSRK